MLERIREGSQGVWAMSILGLVILSFVFAGVGSYVNCSAGDAAATVNGEEIASNDLEKAYQNERARMESQFGDAFSDLTSDAIYLQSFRQGILDRLIGDKLIDQAAQELGLRVSDDQIKAAILTMQEFQVDGQFDNDRYLAILRQAGYQPNNFRDYMRMDMVRRQFSQSLVGSEFSLTGEANAAHKIQQQTRDLRYIDVPAAKFTEQVTVSEEQMNSYYQANITQFDTDERVSLAYVELKLEDLLPSIEVTDLELADYYQQNANVYRTDPERKVSHILFESADENEAVKAQAEQVLAQSLAGQDFATLAQAHSTDTFSAENGGDLGWFTRGMMDPEFEDAAFALAAIGDVSGVFKGSFGYHIILLTDIKAEQVVGFEEVKADITTTVKTQKAEEEFYALEMRMAEVAFEVPDDLIEVASVANKAIVNTALFNRNAPPLAVSNARILASAFSSELVEDGVNSEVLELGENHIMVIRILAHQPQRTQAIEEVIDQIQTILAAQSTQQAARDWASALQEAMANGQDISTQLAELDVIWQEQKAVSRNEQGLSSSITQALFSMADQDVRVVDLANGDVSLLQMTQLNTSDEVDTAQLAAIKQRLASNKSQALYGALIESLKAQADIQIY
jgi:peptidyl-prolyl cis-trans isomerase D